MNRNAFRKLAGFAVSACAIFVLTQADTSGVSGLAPVQHARVWVHRNDDGTLKHGVRNEVETSNWSGYAVANYATKTIYSAAEGSWSVPKASYALPPSVCHVYQFGTFSFQYCSGSRPQWEYSSSWVGIGGYCENANCTSVDNTLIQLGTEQDASSGFATQYYAWIEMLPNYPLVVSPSYPNCNALSCAYPVKPGDAITASLTCQSNCSPGQEQSWLLTMKDTTQNWTFKTTVSYQSSLLSAVWIQEAPSSSSGVLPLAQFTTATFNPQDNSSSSPNFPNVQPGATTSDAILMVDPYGETSNPSMADAGKLDTFNACWGNNASNIAACGEP